MTNNLHLLRDTKYLPSKIWRKEKGFINTIHFGSQFDATVPIKVKKINFSTTSVSLVHFYISEQNNQLKKLLESREFKGLRDTEQSFIKSWIERYNKELESVIEMPKELFIEESNLIKRIYPREELTNRIDYLILLISVLNKIIQKNTFKDDFKIYFDIFPVPIKTKILSLSHPHTKEEKEEAEQFISNLPNNNFQKIKEELEKLKKKREEIFEKSKLNLEKSALDEKKILEKEIEEKEKDLERAKNKQEGDILIRIDENRKRLLSEELKAHLNYLSTEKKILEELVDISNYLIKKMKVPIPLKSSTLWDYLKSKFSFIFNLIGGLAGITVLWGIYTFYSKREREEAEREREEAERNPHTFYKLLAREIKKGHMQELEKSRYLDEFVISPQTYDLIHYFGSASSHPKIFVLYGSSGSGKSQTTINILNKRGKKNSLYLSFRKSAVNETISARDTLRNQLSEYIGRSIPQEMDPVFILMGALKFIKEESGGKWSKENPIPVILLEDLHKWSSFKDGKWYFDGYVGHMLGNFVNSANRGDVVAVTTVSEMEMLDAFHDVSGFSSRYPFVRYTGIRDEDFKKAIINSKKMGLIFGKNTEIASNIIVETLGSDFASFNFLMDTLTKYTFTTKDINDDETIIQKLYSEYPESNFAEMTPPQLEEKIIETIRQELNPGFNHIMKGLSSRNEDLIKAALISDLIIRCVSNKENKSHLPFQIEILHKFDPHYDLEELKNTYLFSVNEYLSKENLIYFIDERNKDSNLHKRRTIETWREWTKITNLNSQTESLFKKIFIKFPTSQEIDNTCAKYYQTISK